MGRAVFWEVLIGSALIAVLLIVSATLTYRNTRELKEDADWVAHTHEVRRSIADVLAMLVAAESGQRGFLITGDEEFLPPYAAANARLQQLLAALKDLTQDNREQRENIQSLETMIAQRLLLLEQGIVLRRRSQAEAQEFIARNGGKERMDAVRELIARMDQAEIDLLKVRERRSRQAYQTTVSTGLVTAVVALIMVTAFVWLVQRSLAARHRAAAVIDEQRKWFRTTLASIGDAVIATDAAGKVTFLNPVAEMLTQWNMAEARGQPLSAIFKIVNEESRGPVENPASLALLQGVIVGLANHTILIAKDGTERPIDDSAAPIRDLDGNTVGAVLVFRDISERKQAEIQVRQNEQDLTDFFENATIGLHWVGPDGLILRANRADYELLGYNRDEYLGHHIAEFHADQSVIADILRRLQAGERLSEYPARLLCKDGSVKDAMIDSSVMWRGSQFVHTRCFTRDVTERKRSLEQIRFQAHLLDSVEQAAIVTNPDGTIIYWNRFAETLYGWRSEEALGRNVVELVVASADARQAGEIMDRLRGGASWSGEFLMKRRDGTTFPAFVTDTPVFDEAGRLKAIISISIDITERKRSEQTAHFLADASATLAVLVDYDSTLQKVASLAVPDFADWAAIDMIETDGSLRRVAVAHRDPSKVELAHELTRRYPADPNSPQGVWNILRTGKSEIVPEITDELLSNAIQNDEQLRIMRELGLKSYLGVPLDLRGKTVGVFTFIAAESGHHYDRKDLAVAEDLAHRAAIAIENAGLYRELREADHRKDEFLAMLAHELRNPLAPIRSGLDVLAMSQNGDADTIKLMQQQVDHLVRLVDDLLDVSRIIQGKVELRREPVAISSVIQRSVDAVRPGIDRQEQQLSIVLPEEEIWLNADAVRLVQIVQNLLNNASKYNDRGGRIQLSLERNQGGVCISVEDSGIGIEAELLPRVFDLFTQSSRSLDRAQGGLGIGLTLVKTLVEMHGGSVSAFSEGPGRGSRFQVFLPIVAGVPATEPPTPPAGSSKGRRILVVEDNVGAAKVLSILISRLGSHEVRLAHDGPSAVEQVNDFRPEIVLLDIGLPSMDGYSVARRLRASDADRKLLLAALTGYGQEEDRKRSDEAGFDEHLVKPVGIEALQKLLAHPKLEAQEPRP